MKGLFEKFKIVCKKCGKEAFTITQDSHSCEMCSSAGSILLECMCGEKESFYL